MLIEVVVILHSKEQKYSYKCVLHVQLALSHLTMRNAELGILYGVRNGSLFPRTYFNRRERTVSKSFFLFERPSEPCETKIRRAYEGFSFIRDAINTVITKLATVRLEVEVATDDDETEVLRTKARFSLATQAHTQA